jgi:hypothetical protein
MVRQKAMIYPRNATEEAMADIWGKVLGVKEVGVEDSIFELGGDSLLIFRITTLANQKGLPLSVRQVFQHKTVAAICSQLGDSTQNNKAGGGTIQAAPRAKYRRPETTIK